MAINVEYIVKHDPSALINCWKLEVHWCYILEKKYGLMGLTCLTWSNILPKWENVAIFLENSFIVSLHISQDYIALQRPKSYIPLLEISPHVLLTYVPRSLLLTREFYGTDSFFFSGIFAIVVTVSITLRLARTSIDSVTVHCKDAF